MSSMVRRFAPILMLLVTALVWADDAPPALDLEAYAGRVVYVDFWASWCGPCRAAYPWMQSLSDRFAEQGLTVLTVNVDRDRQAAETFLAAIETDLPVIWDPEGVLAAEYKLQGMPTSYIIGRDGTLRATHLGFDAKKTDELIAEIEALLAEPVPGESDETED